MIFASPPRIVAIVEARMTSSRLPGKHLLTANGKPMLQHLIERLKTVSLIDEVVVATTTNVADDELVDFVGRVGARVFRGSELDVMGRVVEAGRAFSADVICEVTGDCPVIDPELVGQAIQTFLVNDAVYTSNGRFGLPDGMGCQVFCWSSLEQSAKMTQDPLDREHVTLHIRHHPELFRPIYLVAPHSIYWPELGLTLDERDDYVLLKKIIEHFGKTDNHFTCAQVIQLLRANPDWLKINQHVQRKGDA
jgi:spore coat polysaccharide biosynthesis protein SpsF